MLVLSLWSSFPVSFFSVGVGPRVVSPSLPSSALLLVLFFSFPGFNFIPTTSSSHSSFTRHVLFFPSSLSSTSWTHCSNLCLCNSCPIFSAIRFFFGMSVCVSRCSKLSPVCCFLTFCEEGSEGVEGRERRGREWRSRRRRRGKGLQFRSLLRAREDFFAGQTKRAHVSKVRSIKCRQRIRQKGMEEEDRKSKTMSTNSCRILFTARRQA